MAPQGMRTVMTGQYSSPCRASSPFGDEGRQGWVSPIMTVHRVDSGGTAALAAPRCRLQKGPACRATDGPRVRRDKASPAIPRYSLTSGGCSPNTRPTWIPRTSSTTCGPRVSTKAQLHADWHLGANVDPQSLRDGTRSCIYYTGPWPRDFHLK